jgi:hypothetical protein
MAETTQTHNQIVDFKLAEKGLKTTIEGAVGLALALVIAFPAKLLLFGVILLYLLGVGLILIGIRLVFMFLLPTLIRFAAPLTVIIDFFETIIVIFIDAAITVVDGIIAVADFFSGKPANNMVHFVGVKLFTVDQVRDELRYILENCRSDTNAWGVMSRILHSVSQKPVCSAMRYIYPSPWLYGASTGVAGWLYEGSAIPDPSPSGQDSNENCFVHIESGYIPPVCAALGSGYVLVEMVVPLYLLIILHSAIAATSFLFLWGITQLGYVVIKAGFKVLDKLFTHFLV